ncbi:MAG: immunoglobulin-like domain-containing protein [Clostridium sp.]
MKKGFCKSVISALVVGTVAVSCFGMISPFNMASASEKKAEAKASYTPSGKYGAGVGIKIPDQINAPFVDMGRWINDPAYSSNGAPKLVQFKNDTNMNFYNLGFIQGTGGVSPDGIVNWGWAGYPTLSERDPNNTQYQGIKKSLKELRDAGGDGIISFGGLNGTPFWKITQDVAILEKTYMELIDGYGLTRIDLDIEAAGRGKAENIANAKAIKKVQDKTGVEVVLTLPVMPEGLISIDMDTFDAYLSEGVDIKMINVMTMCYGTSSIKPGETYATASTRAIDNLKLQIQAQYKKYGITLTDEEAYLKCGTTVSIAFEGSAHPYWDASYSRVVVDHAKQKSIGMTSFWSLNKDALLAPEGQAKVKYEHTNIFKEFGNNNPDPPDPNKNQPPVIKGAADKTISEGQYYNPLYMVTATDDKDGDLTDSLKVTGDVNFNVAGDYPVTISVADSQGLTAKKSITIKVVKGAVIEGEQYDDNKIYNTGDVVVYNGMLFKAKWWTQGTKPDPAQNGNGFVWELISGGDVPQPDIIDLAEIAVRYNLKKGDASFDVKYDFNVDKIVDIYDLVIMARRM